jgi:DNA/RNA-binding domain of Phe-tRNA-synthetase-like protein
MLKLWPAHLRAWAVLVLPLDGTRSHSYSRDNRIGSAMLTITATDSWKEAYPGGKIGLLEISGVDNSVPVPKLDQEKRAIEERLREKYADFSRSDFLKLPVMAAYHRYYRKFGYTYHVLLQLESVVFKGKSLPNVSPLVDANFAAELATLILTAGHDVAQLEKPVTIDVAREGDQITQMNGKQKDVPVGDMLMRDASDVACTILRGQDNRSPISKTTTHVLYVSYAPAGITESQVQAQLDMMEKYVRMFAPGCAVEQNVIICAKP